MSNMPRLSGHLSALPVGISRHFLCVFDERSRADSTILTGTDAMLLSTAAGALTHAGWHTTVLTGRNTFHLGDNTRNSVVDAAQEKTKL